MPDRILREGVLTSDRVCSLSWPAEVFYRRLMSIVDDYGRYDGRLSILLARLYALQIKKVTESDVGKWRLETVKAGLVRVYAVDGKDYVQIENFGQRIQSKPKWPGPDAVPRETRASPEPTVVNGDSPESTAYVGVEVGVVDEVERVAASPPLKSSSKRKTGTPLPPDFTVSDRVRQWATEKGYTRLEEHLESFVSKAKARDYRYVDWDEGFMGAIRGDWANLRTSQRTGNVAVLPRFDQPARASEQAPSQVCCRSGCGKPRHGTYQNEDLCMEHFNERIGLRPRVVGGSA